MSHLFRREGLEPRDIAAKMLEEGSIRARTEESAVRTVRGVVAKIRAVLDAARNGDALPAIATNEIDALERKLERLREDRAAQLRIFNGEPDKDGREATVTSVVDMPNGTITTVKPKWPATARQQALKEASKLAGQIADLEILLAEKRGVEAGAGDEAATGGGLTIIESDKSIPELIRLNGVN